MIILKTEGLTKESLHLRQVMWGGEIWASGTRAVEVWVQVARAEQAEPALTRGEYGWRWCDERNPRCRGGDELLVRQSVQKLHEVELCSH